VAAVGFFVASILECLANFRARCPFGFEAVDECFDLFTLGCPLGSLGFALGGTLRKILG